MSDFDQLCAWFDITPELGHHLTTCSACYLGDEEVRTCIDWDVVHNLAPHGPWPKHSRPLNELVFEAFNVPTPPGTIYYHDGIPIVTKHTTHLTLSREVADG